MQGKKKFIIPVLLCFCLCACSTPWRNSRTGEIRNSVPVYSDCKKEAPEYAKDGACWSQCMDYYYKKNGISNAGACDNQCIKATGKNIYVDDYNCNKEHAKADGWAPQ